MIKVGLIGAGLMGSTHSGCYEVIEGAELVAIADVREEKAQELAKIHNAKIYSTGMELIENANVDVVDICLPTYLHTSHAVAAMNKGKNVFIEKPVCLTEEEGKLLLKTQEETGMVVQIGQVIRFWDEYVWLKKVADSKKFGKIRSASFRRLSPYPGWAWNNWLHQGNKSGSAALDLHIHDVDFMRYLMGEPDSFSAHATRDNTGIIEEIITTFIYGDALVNVETNWYFPADFPFTADFRVMFDDATVVNGADGLMVYYKNGGSEKVEIKPAFEGDNEIGGNISSLGGYYNELFYFIDKLANNEMPDIAPLSDGVKSLKLALCEIESVGGAQI